MGQAQRGFLRVFTEWIGRQRATPVVHDYQLWSGRVPNLRTMPEAGAIMIVDCMAKDEHYCYLGFPFALVEAEGTCDGSRIW